MLEILTSTEVQGMQNVYTPLSLKAHFIFCIIATVLYLTLFYRRGSWHYLAIMAAIDVTFATQTSLCSTSGGITVLGVIEVVLLASAALLYWQSRKKQLAASKVSGTEQPQDEDDIDEDRRLLAEKIQRAKDKKIVDNAFDDGDDE